MIRSLAMTTITLAALLGVSTAGWACGFTQVDVMSSGQHLMPAADHSSDMSDNPMKDCRGTGTSESNAQLPCGAVSAITEIVTPSISPAVAVQLGEPYYPAAASIRNWLIQPEPYPPRA